MKIRAILFDFDGTLADSIDLIVSAYQHTCSRLLGFTPTREQITATIGLPLPEVMLQFSGKPELVQQLRDTYREYNDQHHDAMIRAFPGAQATLAALKQRGLRIAVVTAKSKRMLLRGLECLGLAGYVDAVVALEDTVEHKPHPQPMLTACRLLDVRPEECLCVGDSPYDLQSGHNAGTLTAAVRYTTFPWEQILREGRPEQTLNELAELVALVDELKAKER